MDDEDEWELRRVRIPKGTHLSKSKDSEGAERDLLREDGTNKLLGPTESMPVDEDDLRYANSYESGPSPDSGEPELSWGAQLVVDVIEEIVESIDWEAVLEHIVAPAAKRTKDRLANRLRLTFGRTKAEVDECASETSARSSAQLDTEVNGAAFSLSRDEYRQRVIATLAAEAFAARQRGILANSHIEKDDVPEELVRAVTLVLEGNTSSLAENELAAVMDFLEEARTTPQPYPLPRVREIGEPHEPHPRRHRADTKPLAPRSRRRLEAWSPARGSSC